jgi:ArsR family transcriptional regulator
MSEIKGTRALAGAFKALGDETRLRMLGLLFERAELCVCDFVGALDITQSKASRHLRYLLNAGLLEDRREGIWMHYRLAADLSPERRLILETVERTLDDDCRADLRVSLARWLENKCRDGFEVACDPSLGARI